MFLFGMVKFLFVFYPFAKEGLHITGTKRQLFLEQGIVRVRANSLTQERMNVFSCVAFCDTLRLSRNIRVPHFNFFLSFFLFFIYFLRQKEDVAAKCIKRLWR